MSLVPEAAKNQTLKVKDDAKEAHLDTEWCGRAWQSKWVDTFSQPSGISVRVVNGFESNRAGIAQWIDSKSLSTNTSHGTCDPNWQTTTKAAQKMRQRPPWQLTSTMGRGPNRKEKWVAKVKARWAFDETISSWRKTKTLSKEIGWEKREKVTKLRTSSRSLCRKPLGSSGLPDKTWRPLSLDLSFHVNSDHGLLVEGGPKRSNEAYQVWWSDKLLWKTRNDVDSEVCLEAKSNSNFAKKGSRRNRD